MIHFRHFDFFEAKLYLCHAWPHDDTAHLHTQIIVSTLSQYSIRQCCIVPPVQSCHTVVWGGGGGGTNMEFNAVHICVCQNIADIHNIVGCYNTPRNNKILIQLLK